MPCVILWHYLFVDVDYFVHIYYVLYMIFLCDMNTICHFILFLGCYFSIWPRTLPHSLFSVNR